MSLDSSITRTMRAARIYLRHTEGEFSEFLMDRYGVLYPEDLTAAQIADLLGFLRLLGFGKAKRKWTCTLCMPRARETGADGTAPVPVSQAQLAVLDTLKNVVKWVHQNGFEAWLSRYFSLTEITWGRDASAVITALKGLIRSQKKRCCYPAHYPL